MNTGSISGSDSRLGIHGEKNGSVLRCMLIYTGCFLALSFFVYFLFVTDGRTFVRYLSNYVIDSFAQKYVNVFELKRFINTLFQGGEINTWDWTIGLGADGYTFNITALLSPSDLILYLTPSRYVDLVYSLTVIMRVYLSGAGFILFAKKVGLNDCQSIMGAIAYAFCPWSIIPTIYQGSFAKATMLFPLVMLGEEKLIRRESPLMFILTVGYTVFTVISFAYMVAIVVLIYYPVRIAASGEPKRIDGVVRNTALFFISGVAGILIAGESFIINLLKYGETSGTTGKETQLLWSVTDYLRLPLRLMSWDSMFGSTSFVAIAAIGIVMVPVIVYNACRRKTNALMTVIMFIFVLFPFFNSMFNYFSYPSGRWMFMLVFFYALAAAEGFDEELLRRRDIRIAVTVTFALYFVYILWLQKICTSGTKLILLVSCVICALIIALIWIYFSPSDGGSNKYRAAALLVTAAMCVGIIFNYNVKFMLEYKNYLKVGQGQDEMMKSPERAAQWIEDDGFYRVDQAKIKKVNAQMYFGNRSEYAFYSYMDVGWLELNKVLGNNQGYYLRVWTRSNDNRFGLDFLEGVKYFLGSYGKKKNLSKFAGFGYEPYKTIDGVEVLKNKYSIGPGCMFDAYIRRSEWEKLNFADREFAMLMGVVVPDDEEMPFGMSELMASDIKTGVRQVPYTIEQNKNKTKYIIHCDNDDNHQLLMSFEGVQAAGDAKITLNVKNGNIRKSVSCTRGLERGYPEEEMRDLTVNLGSGRDAGDSIKVRLKGDSAAMKSGVEFDDIKIYSMPLKTYRKYAEKLTDNRLNVTRFTNDHITGTVKADKPEVLYFSIFDNNGWDVYIDGVKADVRDEMNIAFIGVDIEPGEHEVEVKYHTKGVMTGWLVTAIGAALTVIIMLLWKKILYGNRYHEAGPEAV